MRVLLAHGKGRSGMRLRQILVVGILTVFVLGIGYGVGASTRIRAEQKTVYYRSDLNIRVDDKPTVLDVTPFIVDPGWIMVPVEFVSKELGAKCHWEDATSTFSIDTASPSGESPSEFMLNMSDYQFKLVTDYGVSVTSWRYLINESYGDRKQITIEVSASPTLPSIFYFRRLVAIGSFLGLYAYDAGLQPLDAIVVSASDFCFGGSRSALATFLVEDIRAYKEGLIDQEELLTRGNYQQYEQ